MQYPCFVYGTLKPGEANYGRYVQGRSARELPAQLVGAALFDAGPYPYLVLARAATAALVQPDEVVHGVLLFIPAEQRSAVMAALDQLEEYVEGGSANHYERIVVTVQTAEGPCDAWVYEAGAGVIARICQGHLPRIRGGVWPPQHASRDPA